MLIVVCYMQNDICQMLICIRITQYIDKKSERGVLNVGAVSNISINFKYLNFYR